MEHFDAIVVGAGPAGSTAANLLARAGMSVLLIERGQHPGSKNVSGGLIYSRILKDVFPNFWTTAPVERAITDHKLVMLGAETSVSVSYGNYHAGLPPYNAFSVLRAKFDPWLAEQAENAGAMLIPGVTVDELILDNGRVTGIKAGPDKIGADVVVVADGTRSLLLKEAGLREDFHPHDVSIGVKEVIALPEEVITERFQCDPETGTAYTLVGSTGGIEGGGFLYTNKASLSLGVVLKIDSLYQSKRQPHEVLYQLKSHPMISRLIKDGEVVEYSAQTVHRGGFHLIPKLFGDGYVVVGSAGRLLLNNVMTLRGMDIAVASAASAAQAIIQVMKSGGSFVADELSVYEQNFKTSYVYQNMAVFKDAYALMENERLFGLYPQLASNVMEDLFGVDNVARKKVYGSLRGHMQGKLPLTTLLKDMVQISRGMVL